MGEAAAARMGQADGGGSSSLSMARVVAGRLEGSYAGGGGVARGGKVGVWQLDTVAVASCEKRTAGRGVGAGGRRAEPRRVKPSSGCFTYQVCSPFHSF
jgi:hypothetical protein